MEILCSKISKSEFKGRFKFLKKIVYYASIYEWSRLLQYYTAWLRRFEMDLNTRKDDPAQIESAMLAGKKSLGAQITKNLYPNPNKFGGFQ